MGKKSKVQIKSPQIKHLLAIETSCDDTSIAIVDDTGFVHCVKSQNQDDVHAPYGGIIPELACRNHTMRLLPLLEEVLKESNFNWSNIDAIAVTNRPGLLGSLLVGVTVAKTLAAIYDKPIVGINHLEGHLYAAFLKDKKFDLHSDWQEPFLGLCVSGGHTSIVHVPRFGVYKTLGRTLDDAAGEAFDKFGKVLGLGYPAGRVIDQLALKGNAKAFDFPRPLLNKELNFSFSGLKTAGFLKFKELTNTEPLNDQTLWDLCASFQEAVVDVLVHKLEKAIKKTGVKKVIVTGGVAANSRLRSKMASLNALFPPAYFCTDNAAMIGFVGIKKMQKGIKDNLKLTAVATSKGAEIS